MKGLSKQHTFYLTLAGVLILGTLAYGRSIKPTLSLKQELRSIEEEIATLESNASNYDELSRKELRLSQQLGDVSLETSEVRSLIIDRVSGYMTNSAIRLVDMPEFHMTTQSEYQLYSHELIVEGSFHELLSLLHYLETEVLELNIASAEFVVVKEKRTRNEKLHLEILFQNVLKS